MPIYHLKISNSRETDVAIDVENADEAMNAGYNALAMFVCRNFPPPNYISIHVVDADLFPVGSLKMTFEEERTVAVRRAM